MSALPERPTASNFVRDLVIADNEQGTFGGRVQTRFPPEPNGYLHIGHAKAITLDFGIAAEFGGTCNLRFDDTNPDTEETSYVDGIIEDLAWLGFPIEGEVLYASDYFEQLATWAESLIEQGLAYVDDQTGETISEQRGGYGNAGVESPHRNRSVEENLDLFRRMRAGEFAEGDCVLRAKIDMQHENMQMRDPVMYRIRDEHHHRTGDDLEDLPDLRLGARAERRDRGRHAFAVHARVRQPPRALRLVPEQAAAAVRGAAPDRVRPARADAHGHLQAQADEARARRHRRRLGRPAHAHPARVASPRLSVVGDPRVLQLHRCGAHEQPSRDRAARVVRADASSTAPRSGGWRCCARSRSRSRTGPPTPLAHRSSSTSTSSTIRRIPTTAFARCRSPGASSSSRRTSWPSRRRSTSGCRPARRSASAARTSSRPPTSTSTPKATSPRSTSPTTRRPTGGNAPDGRKVKSTMHWVSAAARDRSDRRALRAVVRGRDPRRAHGRRVRRPRRRTHARCSPAARSSRRSARRRPGEVVQFERIGYFAADPTEPMLFHRTVGLRDEWANIQKRTT